MCTDNGSYFHDTVSFKAFASDCHVNLILKWSSCFIPATILNISFYLKKNLWVISCFFSHNTFLFEKNKCTCFLLQYICHFFSGSRLNKASLWGLSRSNSAWNTTNSNHKSNIIFWEIFFINITWVVWMFLFSLRDINELNTTWAFK